MREHAHLFLLEEIAPPLRPPKAQHREIDGKQIFQDCKKNQPTIFCKDGHIINQSMAVGFIARFGWKRSNVLFRC